MKTQSTVRAFLMSVATAGLIAATLASVPAQAGRCGAACQLGTTAQPAPGVAQPAAR